MRKIRYGIFESNSSSSHSLSFSPNMKEDNVAYDKNTLTLGFGEYGWVYEELVTWQDKADYLGVEARDDKDKNKMLTNVLKKRFPSIEIEYYDNGYIDHQSYGNIWNEINNENELDLIIFGDSIIVIDSDG